MDQYLIAGLACFFIPIITLALHIYFAERGNKREPMEMDGWRQEP